MQITKTIILDYIHQQLDKKTLELQRHFDDLKSDLGAEHKSSAGDKHETSRAMIQLEQEKLAGQLNQLQQQRETLSKIDKTIHEKIQFGSLITTSYGIFFMSIGLGKLEINYQSIFCISTSSPIGNRLLNLSIHDSYEFNGMQNTILEII